MWVEAIIAKEDLAKVIGELCPLRITIGEDGSVLLLDPRDIGLVPGTGLRMTVTSEIHWPFLGIHIPVSIRSATLEVRPEILDTPQGNTLTFKLRLDDVDIAMLPALLDRGIVERVNKELEAKHIELAWGFTKTLSHVFELPDALASARALDLRATAGRVQITTEAVALAVSFRATVEPRGVGPAPSSTPSSTAPRTPLPPPAASPSASLRGIRALLERSPAAVAAMCGMGFVAGMGLFALVSGRRRPRTIVERLRD
jgi:hypothetical protein